MYIKKWILSIIFWRCLDCSKNKIVHNFLISSPNQMNQSFIYRQKYNVWEKKIILTFCNFFGLPTNLCLLCHNFCSHAPIEIKIVFLKSSLCVFLAPLKVSENHIEYWDRTSLSKVAFWLRTIRVEMDPLSAPHIM